MATLLITWSNDDNFKSVGLITVEKAMFERDYLESKQPPGIVQLLENDRIGYMETNDFRLKIAKVESGRKNAAGSGNLKEFFEVWLNDPNRRTVPYINVLVEIADPRKMPGGKVSNERGAKSYLDKHPSRCDTVHFGR